MATPNPKIKAIFFDFMGTCLDWHSGTISTLPQSIPQDTRSQLALDWRQAYFDSNAARLAAGQPPESIDVTLRRTLEDVMLKQDGKYAEYASLFDDEDTKKKCLAAWHSMPAWPDVLPALSQLKKHGYELFVFANGTTRLQLDLVSSSNLNGIFSMLFSSELLGIYKPAKETYLRVLDLVGIRDPSEAVMVAAHAYDLRGARDVGMRTVYVHRWTDDVCEDMRVVRGEVDFFLENDGGMAGLVEAIGRF